MESFARTSHYISELLFTHDCVIVPGLGGFVCNYAPAKIHPTQHVFTPPSKHVFFNRHLQNNDGLLVNAIATAVPCSFSEAQSDVGAFADAVLSELNKDRSVELPHLGSLIKDGKGNISFECATDVNFLVGSFGLASFQRLPVVAEEVAEEKPEPVIRRIDVSETETVPEKVVQPKIVQPSFRGWKVAAVLAVPLLAGALLFSLNAELRGVALAGLGVGSNEPSLYQPKTYFVQSKSEDREQPKPDANGNYTLLLDGGSPGMVVSIYKVADDTTHVASKVSPMTPTVVPVDHSKYYVIGGAFGVPQNAENYRKTLIGKGYKPVILSNVKSSLTHIALAAFNSKDEAVNFLSTIQGDINGAWILKQK